MICSLYNKAARCILWSSLFSPGTEAQWGWGSCPVVTQWWSWNQNTSLFCFKPGALPTLVYHRKVGITWAWRPSNSFSFQVREKIPLLSLVMVNVQINTLPRTMGKPMPRRQGKLLKGASRGPPGTAAHHLLGCLILFGTVTTTFAYALLLCFKFSFLSIAYEGIAHPSGSGQWHWSWQNPPTSSCPQLQSCLSLTHCSSLWTWASFGLALALVLMSWVAWVSPVTSLVFPHLWIRV